MARVDYECTKGHVFEDDYISDQVQCKQSKCKASAEIIWMAPRSPHRQLQTPIVMWRYSDGSLGVAGGADSKTPRGAERVEIRSIGEYRRHVKELNGQHQRIEKRKDEAYLEAKATFEKEHRSRLTYLMGQESDPFARDIYREALERDKSERMPSSFSEYFSVAMEMNRSNYE